MKRRRPLELSFDYIDTPERRVLSLAADGVSCVPVLGFDAYRRQWRAAPIHVHEECLEISLCLRGDLEFELGGERYPFRPGTVFVSRPDEPHRLRAYPKGMSKYWILFRIPARGERILGLSAKETAWLVQELTHLPQRLFAGTKEIRALFKRHVFLVSCRIARAKELLTADGKTVAAVAAEVGFATPQHFANHFKLATGLTPREWRERV